MPRTPTCCALVLLALAACRPPEPPDTDRRPEPQAKPAATLHAPLHKARSVEAELEQAAAARRAAVEAAGG